MKILHLCLGNYFIDGYGYQENNLTKQHKRMGYDVEVIASIQTYDANGQVAYTEQLGSYINQDQVTVTRIPYLINNKICHLFKIYRGVYKELERCKPDIIFVHNFQFLDIRYIIKYKKEHLRTTIYVDSHADFSNSARGFFSKNVLHKILWKHYAKKLLPHINTFYGVLPSRVDFLRNVYGLPEGKCKLLLMGADDDYVKRAKDLNERMRIRKEYNIRNDDFLVVTGGKIDKWKTQTLLLMEAVNKIKNDSLRLIIFGSISEDIKTKFYSLLGKESNKIQYAGWISAEQSYSFFEAADLVVFPGRHSVFWEQATGQGVPMIVKDWPGTHHIDLGGNVRFLEKDSESIIEETILEIINNKDVYKKMKDVAVNKGMHSFSYKNIAQKAING